VILDFLVPIEVKVASFPQKLVRFLDVWYIQKTYTDLSGVASWREHLPLDSILILLAEFRPKVSSLCSVASPSTDQAVMDFLKSVTLLDVLPQRSSAFGSRRFIHSSMSIRWLLSLTWSLAYVTVGIYLGGTRVALFTVQTSTARPTDMITAVVRDGSTMITRRLTGNNGTLGNRAPSAVV